MKTYQLLPSILFSILLQFYATNIHSQNAEVTNGLKTFKVLHNVNSVSLADTAIGISNLT